MEPHNYQRLLFFSFFSLTTFNPALAVCVPRNSIYPHTSSPPPYTSPNPQPAASPGPQAVPPQSPPRPLSLGPFSARESALKPPSTQILKINPLKINPGATNTNPAIKKICDSTDYPETCISSITPFLNGRTDPVSVVQMAIKAATLYTTLAISTATKLASIPGTSPKMVSIIKDCKDSYSDALDNFQNAMAALRTLDIGTMNSMLSAAISDFCDCDDELTGQRSPLLEFNGRLSNMTGNCLNIVSMIK